MKCTVFRSSGTETEDLTDIYIQGLTLGAAYVAPIGLQNLFVIGQGLVRAKDTLKTGGDVAMPIAKVITTACVVTWFNPQALIDGSTQGVPMWGIPTQKGGILYLCLEDTFGGVQDRLFKLTDEAAADFNIAVSSCKLSGGLISQLEGYMQNSGHRPCGQQYPT